MSSVVGLELPNAWRTGQTNDPAFDISADQLNVTANRELWIPTGSIDWADAAFTNLDDITFGVDKSITFDTDGLIRNINGGSLEMLLTDGGTNIHSLDMDIAAGFTNWKVSDASSTAELQLGPTGLSHLQNDFYKSLAATPADPPVDFVSIYGKDIDATNKGLFAKVLVNNTYTEINLATGMIALDDLTDVTITNPQDLEFIRFNSGSGLWENVLFSPGAGPAIEAGNSSVTVIDTGTGRVETVIDGTLRTTINANLFDIGVPISMNSQQINSLGTPAVDSDAATKGYVDTEIAALPIKTDLDSLDDVTIVTPLINQVLVNDGLGQWLNQALAKAQLPSEIAYEDEANVFTNNQTYNAGWTMGPGGQTGNLNGGSFTNILSAIFTEQGIDPADPLLTETKMFLDDGADFNSSDPVLEVLIDRGGVITKQPVATEQTIFALRNFSNGMFGQETGVRLATDGGIGIRVQIFNENVFQSTFEVVLDGEIFVIDDPTLSPSVSNTIDLTVGTDVAPTKHWVWIENVTGTPTMMSSTVEFPQTGDFAVVGTFLLQSQSSVLADGAYAVNSPDYEIFDEFSRGHLAHINDNLITKDSLYISGIALSTIPAVGGGTDVNITFTSTAGQSMELHREDIESFDITTGIALVENEGTQTDLEVTRVDDIGLDMVGLTCANQTTIIANNDRVNLVVYTIHNDDEPNQTNYGINLPFDTYGNDSDAIADISRFAVTTVPLSLRGLSLLVAEIVIKITGAAATFEVISVKDLRGQTPGAAGGSGGGGTVSQLNDLSDVTLVTPLLDQILQFDGAGQWRNIQNPAGILADPNTWLNYQEWTAIADPGASVSASEARWFVEIIDANNTGLFCYLQRNGGQQKVRIA